MITSERQTPTSTIRIHDDACDQDPAHYLPRLNKIISGSYKRRSYTRIDPPQP